MKKFISVNDIGDINKALLMAKMMQENPFQNKTLGNNKTVLLIFFNSSLRTRLSTQKAAINLGMSVMVLDINNEAWKLETEVGVIMEGDKPEHIFEAIPVMGTYCDIIGIRTFAKLEDKEEDYNETIINYFIELSGKPVFSMESPTLHPLQSFADLITINEFKKNKRPKIVLTWAPHPRALPQAVANSFIEWMNISDFEFVITHPEGYELDSKFVGNATIEYDKKKAYKDADFVYAKNWSAYTDPNYGKILNVDKEWTVDSIKMELTNNAFFMHCLPVRRNMIVTDEVIDSSRSLVIPQATNRVVATQVVLFEMLKQL